MICFNLFFYIYSNFLTLLKKYEWSICISKFHSFLFLQSRTKLCKFSLVKHSMEKFFLISSLIEISFRKGILPKDSYTKVSYTVLGLASRNNAATVKGCTHCATKTFDGMCFNCFKIIVVLL